MSRAWTGDPLSPWRSDNPDVGLFSNFRDAVAQASFMAAINGWRHRVRYDSANCWWNVTCGGGRVAR